MESFVVKSYKIIFIFMLYALASCRSTWQMQQQRNRDNLLMNIEQGMTKNQVIQIMGKPDLNEAYPIKDGGSILVLFYYTNRKWADGNVTKDECTPLVFENGKLIGWGDGFYENRIKVNLEIKNKK